MRKIEELRAEEMKKIKRAIKLLDVKDDEYISKETGLDGKVIMKLREDFHEIEREREFFLKDS